MTSASQTRAVKVGKTVFGGGTPFTLIAGPCVIEGRDHCLRHAERVQSICAARDIEVVFKSSFDKANRTSGASYRGLGMEAGLEILAAVRSECDMPVLTDVHEASHCAAAAEVVDCLQIPAFLCRQTDLLLAAARTGKAVNIKKGQFLAPQDVGNVLAKVAETGNQNTMITERGASFGYHCLVVDFAGFPPCAPSDSH